MNRSKKLVAMLIVGMLMAMQAYASAVDDNPITHELENNERYIELNDRYSKLNTKHDSINNLLKELRSEISSSGEAKSSAMRAQILELEKNAQDIRQEIYDVAHEIGTMQQENIRQILDRVNMDDVYTYRPTKSEKVESGSKSAISKNLVDNECFKSLSEEEYCQLQEAQSDEIELSKLAEEYVDKYNQLEKIIEKYKQTDRAFEANPLYEQYEEISKRLYELNSLIEDKWNNLIRVKEYSISYIAQKNNKQINAEKVYEMLDICNSYDGKYSSDGLVHYAIGRQTLREFESSFAYVMQLGAARDSLQGVIKGYNENHLRYDLPKIDTVERRILMDFEPIKIGRTNYYDNDNPLPELQVFESGTIYRILLGKFKTKQAMTLFRGVQPLSITRNEEGLYCYYAGGYDNEAEARETVQFLRDKGFKNPELCCWTDGKMKIIPIAKKEKVVAPKTRYIVVINTQTMDDKMRRIIATEAPGKIVSRSGRNHLVGLFEDRGEADTLIISLTEAYPTLEMGIAEEKM